MIEILTLLAGLMAGTMQIDLRVEAGVERVEVRVDEALVVELDSAPWSFRIDWGSELLPRELEVVAFDAAGREVGRDRDWVNLRASPSSAQLVFPQAGSDGRIPHFGIRWRSVGIHRPKAVRATLDGKNIPVTNTGQISLPDYDPDEMHWLDVVVDFGDMGEELLGASLGGEALLELSTELTPVAIEVDGRRMRDELEQGFTVDGEPLRLHGVEKGPIEVLMVCDRDAIASLLILARAARNGRRTMGSPLGWQLPPSLDDSFSRRHGEPGYGVSAYDIYVRDAGISELARLGENTTLRFVWPRTASWLGPVLRPGMFHTSEARPLRQTGLLASTYLQAPPVPPSRVAPAVAMAGLVASSSSRRRAVVLVTVDSSQEDPRQVAMVVRYLQALRVPLYVWTVGADADPGAWPGAVHLGDLERDVRTRNRFDEAVDDLRFDLRRQRIVWLEGRYLPQDVELADGLDDVRWPTSDER